jgi:two-component system sensor histidine kinase SenX3
VKPSGDPRLSTGLLEAALDTVTEGIVICNGEGEVVLRNEAARRQLGDGPGDALAVQAVNDAISATLEGSPSTRRLDLVAPLRRSLSIRGLPVVSAGVVEGAVVVVEDITERMRLESVRRDFVANVSHELKTPTGAMALLAETIDGESDPEVIVRLAKRMGAEAERLGRIIDDLLDLSRIESNESPQKVLVPIAALISQATDPLRAAAEASGVTLSVAQPLPPVAIPGDRRDLSSAVANLVDNAIKYSEAGGEVTVSAQDCGPRIEVSVSDTGVGIPARDLERIFERFYRVDRARSRATGGTGLGLSIVRHVAANHGGSVTVRSVEGEGSTFVLELPALPWPIAGDPLERGEESLG